MLSDNVIGKFLSDCSKYRLSSYYVHTPYFINLASIDEEVRSNSIGIISKDLDRSSLLKAKYVMTHLGSSKEMTRQRSVIRVADSILRILEGYNGTAKLLLENSAGQGDTIGDKFEELAQILDIVDNSELGVCFDTAHVFAAGYDLRDDKELNRTLDQVEKTFGMDKLKLIHGNDSKVGLGGKKDRHELIGEGKIGLGGFEAIIGNESLRHLNLIVENPPNQVAADIKLLKDMRDKS